MEWKYCGYPLLQFLIRPPLSSAFSTKAGGHHVRQHSGSTLKNMFLFSEKNYMQHLHPKFGLNNDKKSLFKECFPGRLRHRPCLERQGSPHQGDRGRGDRHVRKPQLHRLQRFHDALTCAFKSTQQFIAVYYFSSAGD